MASLNKHVLPADPVLERLLIEAQRATDPEIIVDFGLRCKKSYSHLLGDILKTRDHFCEQEKQLRSNQNESYKDATIISILNRNGYEYMVAFFAIRAMGCTPMALAPGILPDGAKYFFTKAKSSRILVGRDCTTKAKDIATYIETCDGLENVTMSPISTSADPVEYTDISIDGKLQMGPDGPGSVVFTSGTTGPPKAVVLPRTCFTNMQPVELGHSSFCLRAGHWLDGSVRLIGSPLIGQKLYILEELAGKARMEAVLNLFRQYQITNGFFSPAQLRALRDALLNGKTQLSDEDSSYWSGRFGKMSTIRSTGAVIESSIRQFWIDLTARPFLNLYGSTELGSVVLSGDSTMPGSIGKPVTGVQIKLSEGDKGELLVKSPTMLTHYLGDAELTRKAFDDDGYFKTGDMAELKDGEYIFKGRYNTDFISYSIYKIPALEVESSLLDLQYVSEAIVVGVPDNDAGNVCGAVVRVRQWDSSEHQEVTLARIRLDLQNKLATYMLPILLRKLDDDETLPYTSSGKAARQEALRQFFNTTRGVPVDILPPSVECWKEPVAGASQNGSWDDFGLRREH